MARFNTFLFDEELFGSSGVLPIEVDGVRVPWVLVDIPNDDEYEFAVNPVSADVPSIQKNITEDFTTSGVDILFEGRAPVRTMNFSGTILHEEHFYKMYEWLEKEQQVALIDDLGRNYFIYLKSFSPTRVYTPAYPWRHEYTASASILSWT